MMQSIEEAWDQVYEFTECASWHNDSCAGYARDAARALALALAAFELAVTVLTEDVTYETQLRRIEALGQ